MSDLKVGKVNLHTDGGSLVARLQDKAGEQPPVHAHFVDRRCGVVWPTTHRPGYFCIIGLEELAERPDWKKREKYATRRLSFPLQFLVEGEDRDSQRFFEKLLAQLAQFHCRQVLAYLDRDGLAYGADCMAYFARRGRSDIEAFNVEDFSDIPRGKPLIDAKLRKALLYTTDLFDRETRLSRELAGIPATAEKGEGFEAVLAFCHVITSYREAPFEAPQPGEPERTGRIY